MADADDGAMFPRVLVVLLYTSPLVALCTCGPAPLHPASSDAGPRANVDVTGDGGTPLSAQQSLFERAHAAWSGFFTRDPALSDGGIVDAGVVDAGIVDAGAGTGGHDAGTAVADAGSSTVHDAGTTTGPTDAGQTTTGPQPDAGCVMTESDPPDEGHNHVDAGQIVVYHHNPPTSGNHWPIWAQYRVHDEEVPREVYVHNLEHGAIALVAGPNASQELIDQLQSIYQQIPVDVYCLQYQSSATPRALMLTDPDLDDNVAVLAWDHELSGSCVNADQVQAFVQAHRGNTTEHICADGMWPYPPGIWPDHINDTDGGPSGMQPAPPDASTVADAGP